MWSPSGFPSKIACLSFESGVRKMRSRKCKKPFKFKKNSSPINQRIICVYNLLHVGSPLNKWRKDGLVVNWIDAEVEK